MSPLHPIKTIVAGPPAPLARPAPPVAAPRILVVGDLERTARLLLLLPDAVRRGADTAAEGAGGCALAARGGYAAIILYFPARRFQALEDCRRMRAAGVQAPILVVGSESSPADVIAALEAGADAYLAATVEPAELRARLAALLRRG